MTQGPATSAGRGKRPAARQHSPGRLVAVGPVAQSPCRCAPPRLPTEWRELHQGFGVRPAYNERLQRWHFTTLFTTRHALRHPPLDDKVRVTESADVIRCVMQRFGVAHLWFRILRNSRQVVRAKQSMLRCHQRLKENRLATLERWLLFWNECEDRAMQQLRERLQTEEQRCLLLRHAALPRALAVTPPEVKERVLWDLYWLLRLQDLRHGWEADQRLAELRERLHVAREKEEATAPVLAEAFVAFVQPPRPAPVVGRDITFKELLHLALSQDATNVLLNSSSPRSPLGSLRPLRLESLPAPATPHTPRDDAPLGVSAGQGRARGNSRPTNVRRRSPSPRSEEADLCMCPCHGTYVGFLSSPLCSQGEWLRRRHSTTELLVPPLTWRPNGSRNTSPRDSARDTPRDAAPGPPARPRRLTAASAAEAGDGGLPALAGPAPLMRRRLRRSCDLGVRMPSTDMLPPVCPPPSARISERRPAVVGAPWMVVDAEKVFVLTRTASGRCRRQMQGGSRPAAKPSIPV